MDKTAIIGTGIAGLGCAWQLRDATDLTLFEQNLHVGGHSNTVEVDERGNNVPIDTGFIVFNKVTYPLLTALFEELGVQIKPSEMSFSVSHRPDDLEYNGMGWNKIFAQRRNIMRPAFHRMLRDIGKFFEHAGALAETGMDPEQTLGEFCREHGLGEEFLRYYLLPMGASVWSTEPSDMLNFPALTLIRFFRNHGFLGLDTHHQWFTVDGGARTYVAKILAGLRRAPLHLTVRSVRDIGGQVAVRTVDDEVHLFDRVILATHADQALHLLEFPTPLQQRLLAPFRYQRNHATLHTDASVMPRRRLAWASWNHRVESRGNRTEATTHYWMNALQGVSKRENYFVSLNQEGRIKPERVLYETVYEHPVFTVDALRAQPELPRLNHADEGRRICFCGSYFRYGFHEDAYASSVSLCSELRLQEPAAA